MPSEQSPSSNARPTRAGSTEKGLHPNSTGGVRRLLGLPMRESGVLSASILTAPPHVHHYGQWPSLSTEENNESFRKVALDEELIEEGAIASADPQSDSSRSLLRDSALLPRAVPENAADTLSTTTKMPAEQREQTSFLIPGVSTKRTEFATLSQSSDTAKVTKQKESQATSADTVAPLHTPVSLPHRRAMAMFDIEFLSRLEHLVTEGKTAEHSVEAQHESVVPRSPNPIEQMGGPNGERGGQDLAQRVEQLQRRVRDLAATVSSQAARNREESQSQRHERMTSAPQRMVIIKRSEASLTTPRAFWERSRLGRLHLRTGR